MENKILLFIDVVFDKLTIVYEFEFFEEEILKVLLL